MLNPPPKVPEGGASLQTVMWRLVYITLFFVWVVSPCYSNAKEQPDKLTDDAVAQALITESINRYRGNCPCPYNRARNGSLCGRRSACSRAGGESPLYYKTDVTKMMIQDWQMRHVSN